jgi:hypothetical protein
MFKRTILALSVAALTLSGVTYAQEGATLVMKSGEQVAGQLIDLGGVGFTIRVNGQERQIPTNDVAAINFAGGALSDADWAKLTDGRQVVILKNGQTVHGQLFDIGGTSPLKITFKTDSGDREFSSNEIGQIVLARPANAVATSGSQLAPATGPGIVVAGNRQWTATGITVRKGDRLTLNTTGEVQLSTDANDIASPAGSKSARYATGAALPRVLAGALIGRIGNGAPFGIGPASLIVAPESGQLFLGVNDDEVGDNKGEFRVEVTNGGTRR